jgi:hypothetical protein
VVVSWSDELSFGVVKATKGQDLVKGRGSGIETVELSRGAALKEGIRTAAQVQSCRHGPTVHGFVFLRFLYMPRIPVELCFSELGPNSQPAG